jgi:aspartate carbamoyltransferase catalytic subunit|tara:strand:- start:672 stop:1550 length:879 start_codon:yes stop_codon:yes gene_type:complete
MRHFLDFQDINKNHLENLIERTRSLEVKPENLDCMALLKFDEPSTRTRLSFAVAAEKLGIKTFESSDVISAKQKGEILKHEVETYVSMGIEILVLRTRENNIDDYREFEDIAVISAGFGNKSHPTQALVDISTLYSLNKINEKRTPVTYVGDVKHSRVFESGRQLLNLLGFKVGVFTDKNLLPDNKNDLEIYESWGEVFENSNAIELLRVQKERLQDKEEINFDEYINSYQLTKDVLNKSQSDLAVLHPMPINIGIEISEDAIEDSKIKYKDQLSHAIPSRIVAFKYVRDEI